MMCGKRQKEQDVTSSAAARRVPSELTFARSGLAAVTVLLSVWAAAPAVAQQGPNPGFDPKQTERRFDAQQSEQQLRSSRSGVRLPTFDRSAAAADTSKQIDLRAVVLTGAHTIPRQAIATVYQPYLGKKVSQADLAAIAAGISELYREAGFHLSRAIVPPQDIQAGTVRIQVIEGSICDLVLKGDNADRFGV